MTDYYAILGVARDATHDVIQRAYRRLSIRYHPDKAIAEPDGWRDPWATGLVMKSVNEAWSVLGSPPARQEYDDYLANGARDEPEDVGASRSGGSPPPRPTPHHTAAEPDLQAHWEPPPPPQPVREPIIPPALKEVMDGVIDEMGSTVRAEFQKASDDLGKAVAKHGKKMVADVFDKLLNGSKKKGKPK